jgi:site-specific recombinase XerD
LTLEKITFVESQCINPQDAIIIRLLVEGISVYEIVNLKKNSLDERNQLLTLKDSSGKQTQIKVTNRCVELFKKATSQTKYVLHNGSSLNRQLSVNLRDSDSLIKVSSQDFIANQSMIMDIDSVILRTIYMRLRRLAKLFPAPELTHLIAAKTEQNEMAYA